MITITIPDYRAKSRNKTATKHWTKYREYRDEVAEFIEAYTKAKDRRIVSPAEVKIVAYFKGKVGVDTSNIDDKMIVDALMKVGILKDDTPAENPIVLKMALCNAGEDKLVIDIYPL